jgi:hypothetical protein
VGEEGRGPFHPCHLPGNRCWVPAGGGIGEAPTTPLEDEGQSGEGEREEELRGETVKEWVARPGGGAGRV